MEKVLRYLAQLEKKAMKAQQDEVARGKYIV